MTKEKHIFDDKRNVKRVIHLLWIICFLLVVVDFLVHRHITHPLERIPAFYPIYGFVGCVLLVVIAKWMRKWLMRSESYYEQEQNKTEPSQQNGPEHVDS